MIYTIEEIFALAESDISEKEYREIIMTVAFISDGVYFKALDNEIQKYKESVCQSLNINHEQYDALGLGPGIKKLVRLVGVVSVDRQHSAIRNEF